MPEKKFIFSANQQIWDAYYNMLLDEWDDENISRLNNITYSLKKEQECLKKLSSYSKKSISPYEFEFIRKKQSIQQYKPIVMSFEKFVNKSFHEVTQNDLEDFKKITSKKCRLAHLNAFFLECVSRELIETNNINFMISLLPDNYQRLGRIISEVARKSP